MRRLISITALAVFLAVPLWAQRGGGHAGGHGGFAGGQGGFSGGHAGFSGGHMGGGHFGGGHFSAGMHSNYSRSARSGGFHRGTFQHNGTFRHNGSRDRRVRTYGFRNNCYGWGCGRGFYPGWGGYYYDPWLWDWWDSHSSYDEDYERNLATANEMNQQSLEQQRMLRQEDADGDQDSYARPSRSRSSTDTREEQQTTATALPTVLVFRDRHQEEIRNYAIVGQTLWNFSSQRTRRISLTDLDLEATMKANEDRGLTFRLPASNEAQ